MSRRLKWQVATVAGMLVLLAAVVVSSKAGSHSPTVNPGLTLRFVGFTNINSQWYAQMVLTNQSENTHFVSFSGGIPDYWGQAVTSTGTNELHGKRFTAGPAELPAQQSRNFRIEFPKYTESWQITVYCMRSDPFSRSLVKWSHWFSGWPNWLVEPTARVFLQPTWDRDFEVSSGILTNRPPEP